MNTKVKYEVSVYPHYSQPVFGVSVIVYANSRKEAEAKAHQLAAKNETDIATVRSIEEVEARE